MNLKVFILLNIILAVRAQVARVAVGGSRVVGGGGGLVVSGGGSRVVRGGGARVVGGGARVVGGGARVVSGGTRVVSGGGGLVGGGLVGGGLVGSGLYGNGLVQAIPISVGAIGLEGLGLGGLNTGVVGVRGISSGISGLSLGGLGYGGVVGSQVTGPVNAAIFTQRSVDVVDVPVPQDVITPQTLIVEPNVLPVNIEFRSQSSPVNVNQVHIPGQPGQIQATRSEEEPDRLVHEVVKPVIQEIHETITPYRRITQEILPVQEQINTVVARGENVRQVVQAAPAVSNVAVGVQPVGVVAQPVGVIAQPVVSSANLIGTQGRFITGSILGSGLFGGRGVGVTNVGVAQPVVVGGGATRVVGGGGVIGGGLVGTTGLVGRRVVGQPIVTNIRRA